MAKKKTRVLLPGGIQGLVHDLQNGTSNYAQKPIVDDQPVIDDEESEVANKRPETEVTDQQADVQGAGKQTDTSSPSVDESASSSAQPTATATKREDVAMEVTPVEAPAATVAVTPAEPQATEPDEAHGRGRRPKENTMKEYHIVKDDSVDSWELFIDMAQQYKTGGGKLATIYIDESLKSVLDRMKYAGTEKLSTSAILSSIVARFIYDHEDDIKKVLFSGNLL
ncbi:MAG: hypothetical protein I3J02_08975 [Prevotella sp.]|nr:hypothetical protein [Prevotella sp.]